ncbi:hypothetical protein [Micromonospora cathayae]|uniref:Uncharacterized protein n=1 Tax=Micromonospora cathayae TaxID=3028804 RepID=A0ABY7ZUG1_9ACTN|nr:hypothetical protein [Micromonospora sp. HUAS 3]WDZ86461.1 hypothetical protein PVK37_08710 [Micromonospora sp. HUAS 3]
MEVGWALLLAPVILAVSCLSVVVARFRRRGKRGWFRGGFDRGRPGPVLAGWRERHRRRRVIVRLDRAVDADSIARHVDLTEFDRDDRRPLEEIAADLWRLREYRIGRGGRPIVWPLLLIKAYDDRLRSACRCLGIPEHLADLEGVDREIERVRVEGELHAAGLPLPAAVAEHRQRHH